MKTLLQSLWFLWYLNLYEIGFSNVLKNVGVISLNRKCSFVFKSEADPYAKPQNLLDKRKYFI